MGKQFTAGGIAAAAMVGIFEGFAWLVIAAGATAFAVLSAILTVKIRRTPAVFRNPAGRAGDLPEPADLRTRWENPPARRAAPEPSRGPSPEPEVAANPGRPLTRPVRETGRARPVPEPAWPAEPDPPPVTRQPEPEPDNPVPAPAGRDVPEPATDTPIPEPARTAEPVP